MGLFDGAGALDERGSTAHLAKILAAPVVLVVNGKAMARSAAALVAGFAGFDRRVAVKAVIFNNLGSEGHYRILREAVETETNLPVLGYLPRCESIALPERHLGLTPAAEHGAIGELTETVRRLTEEHIDVDRLIALAAAAPDLPAFRPSLFSSPPAAEARIAVAMDEAFHFYYQDNLDILEHLGAEIVPFSPLRDRDLPAGTEGIYIGGGFPEEFAAPLAGNVSIREGIRSAAEEGVPVLAECGGLMYLAERLEDRQGAVHPMAGVFPGVTRMGKRLQALGYHTGRLERAVLPGVKGTALKGHLFHWSQYDSEGNDHLFSLRLEKNGKLFRDGLARKNTFASYLHIHFGTNPAPAKRFLRTAARRAGRK
jgi:cobyrinic acid a,c-diamide synthase